MPPKKKRVIPRPVFFITTVPVIRPCSRCGVWLAAGIVEGIHSQVDLVQLDQVQSSLAIIAGVRLYSMTRTGMVQLDQYRLRDPRFSGRFPEHKCGVVWEARNTGAGPIVPADKLDAPPF